MDIGLRQAQRKYEIDPTVDSLDYYNRQRQYAGLPLLPFYDEWLVAFRELISEFSRDRTNYIVGRLLFHPKILFSAKASGENLILTLQVIENSKTLNPLKLASAQTVINRQNNSMSSTFVYKTIGTITSLPHSRSIILNHRAIVDDLVQQFKKYCDNYLIDLEEKLERFSGPYPSSLPGLLKCYLDLKICLNKGLKKNDGLDNVFTSDWFRQILRNYGRFLEHYVQECNKYGQAREMLPYEFPGWELLINSSGRWPGKGQYSLTLYAGYEDTTDEEEPYPGDVEGDEHGPAYEVADTLCECLNEEAISLGYRHSIAEPWTCDLDIEGEAGVIEVGITAVRRLTSRLLRRIIDHGNSE